MKVRELIERLERLDLDADIFAEIWEAEEIQRIADDYTDGRANCDTGIKAIRAMEKMASHSDAVEIIVSDLVREVRGYVSGIQ